MKKRGVARIIISKISNIQKENYIRQSVDQTLQGFPLRPL